MMRSMVDSYPWSSTTGSDYGRYVIVGTVFLVILCVFGVVGFLVDNLLRTLPLFLLVGLGVGFGGGLYYLYRAIDELGR
jgi:ATP synthase protein I